MCAASLAPRGACKAHVPASAGSSSGSTAAMPSRRRRRASGRAGTRRARPRHRALLASARLLGMQMHPALVPASPRDVCLPDSPGPCRVPVQGCTEQQATSHKDTLSLWLAKGTPCALLHTGLTGMRHHSYSCWGMLLRVDCCAACAVREAAGVPGAGGGRVQRRPACRGGSRG